MPRNLTPMALLKFLATIAMMSITPTIFVQPSTIKPHLNFLHLFAIAVIPISTVIGLRELMERELETGTENGFNTIALTVMILILLYLNQWNRNQIPIIQNI